jgi:hypothetical protein
MQSEVNANDHEEKKAAAIHDRMLAFTFTQGKYWVFNGKEISHDMSWENIKNKAWIVLNHVANNKQSLFIKKEKYRLKTGDIVRFGRVVFKVTIVKKGSTLKGDVPECEEDYDIVDKSRLPTKQAVQWESTKTVLDPLEKPELSRRRLKGKKKDENTRRLQDSVSSEGNSGNDQQDSLNQDGETVCRICYGREDEPIDDPLIAPCKCSGSVKHVHLSCAKAWINEELTQDVNEHVKSYCWERISCEMCNDPFKDVVNKDGRRIKLFEKEKITADTYMVLESIYPDYIKIYFGLIVDKENESKKFPLGRSRN